MCRVQFLWCVLVVVSLTGFTNGQVEFKKPCPPMPSIMNFNISEFGGKWFELARYDHPLVAGGECITMSFEVNEKTAKVENTLRRKDKDGNLKAEEKINLVAEFQVPSMGTFNLSHPVLNTKAEYRILTTDYQNFALVWRCEQVNSSLSKESAWLLSRNRQLSGTINQTVEEYIRAVLSPSQLHRTVQDEEVCSSAVTDAAVKVMIPVAIVWVFTVFNLF